MENGLNFENKDDLKSKALYNTQVKIKGMYKLIEFIKNQINETTSAIYTEIQNCDDTIEVIKRHNMVANIKCVFLSVFMQFTVSSHLQYIRNIII